MAKRDFAKKPLYRKVNRRTHSLCFSDRGGAEYRWTRNAKDQTREAAEKGALGKTHYHGLDYTPLYRFLLSQVGTDWAATYQEACTRLPDRVRDDGRDRPIFDMVYDPERDPDAKDWIELRGQPMHSILRAGDFTLFSTLCVDDAGHLQKVDPDLGIEHISPWCPCHTHTFNGQIVTNPCRNPAFVTDDTADETWDGFIRRPSKG
ncbi:MAG: hypothetical protein QNJ20_09430 [Paracoccaceae bacterium]|nr:hypothetical protein [Paracoccaceae bacterium]